MTNETDAKTAYQTCPQCGAPAVSEVCSYCGAKTRIKTEYADMEYPVIDCREATLTYLTVGYPLLFGVPTTMVGIAMSLYGLLSDYEVPIFLTIFGAIFVAIGLYLIVQVILLFFRYLYVFLFGKQIEGIVYGYLVHESDICKGTLTVKIFTQTKEGPRILLYQLGKQNRPYATNGKIRLKVRGKTFLIIENKAENGSLWS